MRTQGQACWHSRSPCGTERLKTEGRASPSGSRPSLCPSHAAKPLISGQSGPGRAGIGLRPQAVLPPYPHPRQPFLEEAAGLLGPSPASPLTLRWGGETSTFLVWGGRRGGVSKYLRPREPSYHTPALLLSVTRVHGSLGATEPLDTSQSQTTHSCSKCSLLFSL